ncbi:hypothetical protein EK904_003536 [Melospiza melodia maxima]|nr:hypothetical protein EK904_003536 [Melospiza melodia maxima]
MLRINFALKQLHLPLPLSICISYLKPSIPATLLGAEQNWGDAAGSLSALGMRRMKVFSWLPASKSPDTGPGPSHPSVESTTLRSAFSLILISLLLPAVSLLTQGAHLIIVGVKLIFKDGYDRLDTTDSFVILGRKSGGAKTSLPFISWFPHQLSVLYFVHNVLVVINVSRSLVD